MTRVARMVIGCCALGSVALLATASAQAPTRSSCVGTPSKLDYVVMASMADSPSLMGLSVPRLRRNP